jgi:HlyD family secretion protein
MKKLLFPLTIITLLLSCEVNNKTYDAVGTFNATELIVSSEVAGTILKFDIVEGDILKKDEIVGLIDTVQLYLQKEQLLQNINAIEANRPTVTTQLAPLEEQLAKQHKEKERVENLLEADVATQKQLDDINSAIAVLEKQIEAQKKSLNNSVNGVNAQTAVLKTQIAQIEDRLNKCRITVPMDGIVIAKYVNAGELTSAGRPMMKIADMENVHLKAYFTSDQLTNIKIGQKVKVRADFGKGNHRNYDGKITWIANKSEFTPKNIVTSDDRANMVYAIKIAVHNDGYIKLGMYGEVILK